MSNVVRLRYTLDADHGHIDASASDGAARLVSFAVLVFVIGILALFVALGSDRGSTDSSADTSALTMYGP